MPQPALQFTSYFRKIVSQFYGVRCGAGAQTCDWFTFWVRFPLQKIIYLIFLFLFSGVEKIHPKIQIQFWIFDLRYWWRRSQGPGWCQNSEKCVRCAVMEKSNCERRRMRQVLGIATSIDGRSKSYTIFSIHPTLMSHRHTRQQWRVYTRIPMPT